MKDLIANEAFDDFGRCIPNQLDSAVHQKVRRYFKCEQPELDLDAIYMRLSKTLGGENDLSCEDFKSRIVTILDELKNDNALKNICHGVYVPFFIPKSVIGDMGLEIENRYLPAVSSAFKEKFPDYDFTNHYKGSLESKLSIEAETRHENLVEKLESDCIVGIYFPALDGYSIAAAREQVKMLPECISLAGGIDTCAAFIGSPDLLLRLDGYPPLLWFGALETKSSKENFHMEAYGYDLNFNSRVHLGNADEYWANGLVVTG